MTAGYGANHEEVLEKGIGAGQTAREAEEANKSDLKLQA